MLNSFNSIAHIFVLFFVVVHCLKENSNEFKSISSGLSFGFCRGYCQQSIKITADPAEVIVEKRTNSEENKTPIISKQFPFDVNQFKTLTSTINFDQFQALNDRIGCPDCADGGAEWLEIVTQNGLSKRVTFENGAKIENFQEFISKVRQLRADFIKIMASTIQKEANFVVISWNVLHIIHELNYAFYASPIITLFGMEENCGTEMIRLHEIIATLTKILRMYSNKECFVCLQEVPGDLIPLIHHMFESLKISFPSSKYVLHQSTHRRMPNLRRNVSGFPYTNPSESLVIIHCSLNNLTTNIEEDQLSMIPCPIDGGKAAQVLTTKTGLNIINVHVPHRSQFAESLLSLIPWKLAQQQFVMVGDMNHSIHLLYKLLETLPNGKPDLCDIVPVTTKEMTRIGYYENGNPSLSWIDYYLVSKSLESNIYGEVRVWNDRQNISDHFPISLEFSS